MAPASAEPAEPAGSAVRAAAAARPRPRILLVHGNAPWQPNGGGVFLEEMCARAPCDFAHLAIGLEGRPYDVPPDFPRPIVQLPSREGLRGMGVLQRVMPERAAAVDVAAVRPWQLRRRLREIEPPLRALSPGRVVLFLNAVEVVMITMAVYLTISLVTSTVMNWYNSRIALVER